MMLRDYFAQAKAERWAIGHFNFATPDVLRAIVEGATHAGAPCVIVGTSEGEAGFLGMREAVALVHAVRAASGFPVFLNADHFKSFVACKEAIDAGYDSVLFDGSRLAYEVNVIETQRVWQYAQTKRGSYMIEAELGHLRGSSEVQTRVAVSREDYTKPEQAADFVRRTGVERLAPVFGNIHGIVTEQKEELDIDHLAAIAAAVPDTYLVLHGASGLPDAPIADAIRAGITNVHFNTELRVAYQRELKKELVEHPDQTTPYQYLGPAADAVRDVVEAKCRLFMADRIHP
ncbi:MAG: class II fructose-bisphosphate aldolase [Candidatus Yanofskybacteria bacterium]|nr:class II fructose-bisphosphate aldolase [Candidatus Yanofskybacteria bacterium]